MDSITQQIEQMIMERAKTGPSMVGGYKSSLESAASKDQQSIDSLRGIYSDPSKFEKSKLGAFGLGLMAPTKSGNFGEGMFNALSAATAAQDYNQQQNLSREEKLAKLSSLEAQLGRQKAQDQMSVYDTQTNWMKNAQGDNDTLSDIRLDGQSGPRPLGPGEFGPEAPGSDLLSKSMKTYNDYLSNPNKYAGPRGRQLVEDAISVIKNERTNASRERVAGSRSANKSSYGQIAADKKFGAELADWYANGGESDYQKQINQLTSVHSRLEDKDKETSGWITGRMPDWINSFANPDAINSREQVGEVVQRNLRNILGAQFTQKEGDALISRAYNPALDEATNARRVKALMKQMEEAHKTKVAAIKYFEENGTLAGFNAEMPTMADFDRALDQSDAEANGAAPRLTPAPPENTPPQLNFNPDDLPDEVRSWAQEQIDGGADPSQVLEYLNENYGITGE